MLEPDKYYHIYNKGINGCNLFEKNEDYYYFLKLFEKYIIPIADCFAWVLMKNHFHFLVRIKHNICYKYSNINKPLNVDFNDIKWETTDICNCINADRVKLPNPIKHFSHLFSSHTKYFNTSTNRTGSLFQRSFHRKEISTEEYFRQLVLYIHNNPVHHKFCDHLIKYKWSSYKTCIYEQATRLQKSMVIEWFGDLENFKHVHHLYKKTEEIDEWLSI